MIFSKFAQGRRFEGPIRIPVSRVAASGSVRPVGGGGTNLIEGELPVNARKNALIAASLVVAAAVGCARKTTISNSDALDIAPPAASATPVYTQPQPVAMQPAAQPVVYDTQQTNNYPAAPTPTNNTGSMGGSSYTVKKGDTLFSIARTRYGNGNQWQRIAAANPGLSPQTLKAGQTIQLPN
jgi:nucleoid-associated protein YgaU